ncbi:NERD domain-containing protein [Brevundimonas sp. SGAir0440]|uniref:NERD domain-containing protein n=1 Tax=Brevundimonas sp. SGAir0440 TaxID=2579977 RepID=UPI00143CDCCF|nr:NERD domain-containing protein [Brevundimonas sp. SGAir0440]
MAICIPNTLPENMPHDSEALLMRAFQTRLGDDYLVFHSFPWLAPERDDLTSPVREGEADFVLLHREKGMLVIEAKGGEVVLRNRQWSRLVGGGRLKDLRDPAQQVRRAARALRKRIELICGETIYQKVRFATAVAFPHCVFRDTPPADLPARTIMTMDDLADIENAIDRAYDAFGRFHTALTGPEFEAVRQALAPEFAVCEPLKLDVDAAGQVLARLTRQQIQILNGFAANPRAVIHGVAGSGKTMLGLQRARRFARDGCSVLFTCFNAELARWLNEQIANDEYDKGSLTIRHFHGLAAEILKKAGLPLDPVGDNTHYWDVVVPDQMATAAAALYPDDPPFDALVVDEAQDFSPGWWDALAYLTGLGDDVPTWAFLDRDQSLRRDPVDPPLENAAILHLDTNCRNTRRIVGFAAATAKITAEAAEMAPLGRPPRLIFAQTQGAMPGLVQGELQRLLRDHRLNPDQVALIGPTAWKNGVLARWTEMAGVKLTDSASEWRKGQAILCTTARSFKGLEADVVILYGINGVGGLFTESDLYVAVTRARGHLLVVTQNSSFADQMKAAIIGVSAIGTELEAL